MHEHEHHREAVDPLPGFEGEDERYVLIAARGCASCLPPLLTLSLTSSSDDKHFHRPVRVEFCFPVRSKSRGWFFRAVGEEEQQLVDEVASARRADREDEEGNVDLPEAGDDDGDQWRCPGCLRRNSGGKGRTCSTCGREEGKDALTCVSQLFARGGKGQEREEEPWTPSLPLLWDSKEEKVVSSDAATIALLLAQRFPTANRTDLFPHIESEEEYVAHEDLVHELLEHLHAVPAQVLSCPSITDFRTVVTSLHVKLEALEGHLSEGGFILGDSLAYADFVLYAFVLSFDAALVPLFRLGKRLIATDYPALTAHMERISALRCARDTVSLPDVMIMHWRDPRQGPSAVRADFIPSPPESLQRQLSEGGSHPSRNASDKDSGNGDHYFMQVVLAFVLGVVLAIIGKYYILPKGTLYFQTRAALGVAGG